MFNIARSRKRKGGEWDNTMWTTAARAISLPWMIALRNDHLQNCIYFACHISFLTKLQHKVQQYFSIKRFSAAGWAVVCDNVCFVFLLCLGQSQINLLKENIQDMV